MSTAIEEYSPTEAALAELSQRYKGVVYDVTIPTQLALAKAARNDIRGYRTALEKKRVQLKADVLERGRQIDGEAKRITAALSALEDPIEDQIKAEERRIEAERVAAEQAEAARIVAEEAARKKAEEDRLAAERAEIKRRQDELDRAERESREKREAEERASRQRIEEQERVARVAREAEEAKQREERERIAAEARAVEDKARAARLAEEEAQRKARAEQEAKAKAEREAREAVEREQARKAAEIDDSRAVLQKFVERFGHMPVYAEVVKAAKAALKVKQTVAKGAK